MTNTPGLPKIPGVHVQLINGKLYLYHRKTKTRILAVYGTPEFDAELARLNGDRYPREPIVLIGTLGELIDAYRAHHEFMKLAPRTRNEYHDKLNFLKPLAGMPLSEMTRGQMIRIRDRACEKHTWSYANYVQTVMHVMFRWGVAREYLPFNPASGISKIDRPKNLPVANRAWAPDEIEAVLAAATGGLRVGIALGAYLAMRAQDMLAATWSMVDGDWAGWVQLKTGDLTGWEIDPHLAQILDEAKAELTMPPLPEARIVRKRNGTPYTADGFRTLFFRLIKRLESEGKVRPGLTFHGFRHTAGKELVESGGSSTEVQSRLGHRTRVMAEHYSRAYDRKKSARSGAAKLRAAREQSQ